MNFTSNRYTPTADKTVGTIPRTVKKRSCASSPNNKIQSNGLTKKTNNKPIIFPQLQEASMYIDDKFWVDVLLKAARGEFISNLLSFDGTHMKKDDTGIKERMPEDPKELCKAFIIFHKKHEPTYSRADMERQQSMREELVSKNVVLSWGICNNEMKQSRLIEYSRRMTSTTNEAIDMLAVLRTALLLKILTPQTVTMENNVITDITCISYNKARNMWYIH